MSSGARLSGRASPPRTSPANSSTGRAKNRSRSPVSRRISRRSTTPRHRIADQTRSVEAGLPKHAATAQERRRFPDERNLRNYPRRGSLPLPDTDLTPEQPAAWSRPSLSGRARMGQATTPRRQESRTKTAAIAGTTGVPGRLRLRSTPQKGSGICGASRGESRAVPGTPCAARSRVRRGLRGFGDSGVSSGRLGSAIRT